VLLLFILVNCLFFRRDYSRLLRTCRSPRDTLSWIAEHVRLLQIGCWSSEVGMAS